MQLTRIKFATAILLLLVLLSLAPFFFVPYLRNDKSVQSRIGSSGVNLTIWSSDFHISPVADAKNLLAPFNVRFIDKSLSGHCHLTSSCQTNLRVINSENGITLDPCPNEVKKKFFNAYSCDKEMHSVDAILCTHACSMCEMFMPFNKPLIVIASTRYEIGRYTADRWMEWNRNLERIASVFGNVVAANNKYDLEYMKYFTALKNIELLPSYCGYVTAVYSPVRPEILVAPGRGVDLELFHQLRQKGKARGLNFRKLSAMYPHYEFPDLAAHRAFVLLPYQVSFMLFFELYRMSMPMFVPSPRLLTAWHIERRVLHERTWGSALYSQPQKGSAIPRHPQSSSALYSDPNDDFSSSAVLEWVSLADFYVFPHVVQFDSFDELMEIIQITNLTEISSQMQVFNVAQKSLILEKWSLILSNIKGSKTLRYSAASSCKNDVNEFLRIKYSSELLADNCIRTIDYESPSPHTHFWNWLASHASYFFENIYSMASYVVFVWIPQVSPFLLIISGLVLIFHSCMNR
jgi:hypothetical protein